MEKNTIDLLVYLESQLVFKNGHIHEDKITTSDRKQLDIWDALGHVEVERLPRPDRHEGAVMFTHKIRFSEEAWAMAQEARMKKAQMTTPTLKNTKSKMRLVKGDQAEGPEAPEDAEPALDYDSFVTWLDSKNAELTLPQQKSARMFFEIMKMDDINYFWRNVATGKSWLLKAMDQFITHKEQGFTGHSDTSCHSERSEESH